MESTALLPKLSLTPIPRDDEVLVKIRAVSVNDWDWANLQGVPKFFRIFGGFKPKQQILGSDIAGVVVSIGKNVRKFKPGDEVFGDLSGRWGGFAEYVCAGENKLALKSPSMSFAEAAAIPQAGMLAVQGLIGCDFANPSGVNAILADIAIRLPSAPGGFRDAPHHTSI